MTEDTQTKEIELGLPNGILSARYLGLNCQAKTPECWQIVDSIVDELVSASPTNKPSDISKYREAVAPILGALLGAARASKEGWAFRPTYFASFKTENIKQALFERVVRDFIALEWLEQFVANKQQVTAMPYMLASRFRLTDRAVRYLRDFELTPDNMYEFFKHPRPPKPIILKRASTRQGPRKMQGRKMKLDRTNWIISLEKDMHARNDFLLSQSFSDQNFNGLVRMFHNGDQADFDWDQGGRLYVQAPDSYMVQKSSKRAKLTINDEPVCEIDIRASQLRILSRIAEQELTEEPYVIEGIPTAAVKLWVVLAIGAGKAPKRWSKEASEGLKKAGIPKGSITAPAVGAKVTERYPWFLELVEAGIGWAKLQFIESQAVLSAMDALRHQGIPAYPVHDSIIVPQSKERVACEALQLAYQAACRTTPALKVSRADGTSAIAQGLPVGHIGDPDGVLEVFQRLLGHSNLPDEI